MLKFSMLNNYLFGTSSVKVVFHKLSEIIGNPIIRMYENHFWAIYIHDLFHNKQKNEYSEYQYT